MRATTPLLHKTLEHPGICWGAPVQTSEQCTVHMLRTAATWMGMSVPASHTQCAAVPAMRAKYPTSHVQVLCLQGKPEQKRKVRKLEDGQYVKVIGTVHLLNGELRFKAYHSHFPSHNEVATRVPWHQGRIVVLNSLPGDCPCRA